MSNSLVKEFAKAGVKRTTSTKYRCVPFHVVKVGEHFVPIEKMGKKFYYIAVDKKTGRKRHVGERRWCITPDLFVKCSKNGICRSLTRAKDAIFTGSDWAIVVEKSSSFYNSLHTTD